jgi:hypothetical protein
MNPIKKSKLAIGRTVLIVVLVVVVIVVGGAAAAASLGGSSKTSSTLSSNNTITSVSSSSSSSSIATSSSTHSSTSSQKGPLSIVVTGTILDTVEPSSSGYNYYIYYVNVTNTDHSTNHLVDALYFQLTTASNAVAGYGFALAVQDSLQAVTISPGQHDYGQIAFKVAATDKPASLAYTNPSESVNVVVSNLPQPSVQVSEISGFSSIKVSGNSNLDATYSVNNQSEWFYSGQVVSVKIAFNDFFTGSSATVSSIGISTPGLSISSISPQLPIKVVGGGSEVDVTVYVTVPTTAYNGNLNFTITASS